MLAVVVLQCWWYCYDVGDGWWATMANTVVVIGSVMVVVMGGGLWVAAGGVEVVVV